MAARQNPSRHSGYVLKFISGKYQGGEFPIEAEGEIVIGRSSELDMVLVEDMVSRHHATITSSGGEIWIEDFGSTNGTFVNGEKITKVRLKEGDRILIGTSIIKLVFEEPGDEEQAGPAGGFASSGASAAAAANARHTQSGTTTGGILSGMIDQVPLPDLLQLFGASKKSGCLIIQADREGRVYMRDGRVYAATIDDDLEIPMDKAFYRMMAWSSGSFILDNTLHAEFENEIDVSVESLMMEGMRLLDEIHNIGDDVPDYSAHMHLPVPLVPPLRNLTPELLDTLQLVHNYGRVETVLNKSLATDLETLQDIVYLIRNEYVRVE